MEDENKVLSIMKIVKIILLIIAVVVIAFSGYSLYITNSNKNNLNNYFKDHDYKDKDGVWSKNNQINENSAVINTNYIYTMTANTFIKNILTNSANYQEQIDFKYNGTNEITINYSFDGIDEKSNECVLVQTATYNSKDDNFTCNIKYNSGSCPLRCDLIEKASKSFDKEINKILDDTRVNKLFLAKNN